MKLIDMYSTSTPAIVIVIDDFLKVYYVPGLVSSASYIEISLSLKLCKVIYPHFLNKLSAGWAEFQLSFNLVARNKVRYMCAI